MTAPLPNGEFSLPTDEVVAEFIHTWEAEKPEREAAIRLQAESLRGKMGGRCGFHRKEDGIVYRSTTGPRG